MTLADVLRQRRSIKRFTNRPVSREEIETLLTAATLAPNHRLTQPWRFYVLGPQARQAYGLALGERKARKLDDAGAADALRDRVADEHRALPCMIVVAIVRNESAEMAEEDYAAAMMGIENLALAAVEMGLGTHIKTGGVMEDPDAREAVGVADDQRIVAVVNVGEPAEVPPPKPRRRSESLTTWTK